MKHRETTFVVVKPDGSQVKLEIDITSLIADAIQSGREQIRQQTVREVLEEIKTITPILGFMCPTCKIAYPESHLGSLGRCRRCQQVCMTPELWMKHEIMELIKEKYQLGKE